MYVNYKKHVIGRWDGIVNNIYPLSTCACECMVDLRAVINDCNKVHTSCIQSTVYVITSI